MKITCDDAGGILIHIPYEELKRFHPLCRGGISVSGYEQLIEEMNNYIPLPTREELEKLKLEQHL